jgi:hypothetical protein
VEQVESLPLQYITLLIVFFTLIESKLPGSNIRFNFLLLWLAAR